MKKLVLSVVFAGAALAVQAGGDKCCGDCSSTKVQTSTQTSTDAKDQCCMSKQTTKTKAGKSKELASKPVLQSPKAKG
jgi:hypothetical protein